MAELSPQAQAVLDAACTGNAEGDVMGAAAAALRAAAPLMWFVQDHQKLLAIAAELEGAE